MSAPLTHAQKAHLARLAARAFNRANAIARGQGEQPAADAAAWRRDQVAVACGKLGLRCASQRDYKLIEARFLDLLGDTTNAFRAGVRAATEDRRQAYWHIAQACARLGKPMAYANAISRQMFRGLTLDDIALTALWKVLFALRYQIQRQRREAP